MDFDLEHQIGLWRAALARESNLPREDVQELEDHLRDEVESLRAAGLADDEALLIAMKRMGDHHEVARQLAAVDSDKMWRQFFEEQPAPAASGRELVWVIVAALAAALLGKVPLLFGVSLVGPGFETHLRNLALYVVPVLMMVYYLKNRFTPRIAAFLAVTVLAGALAANLYPYSPGGATSFLVALHLPLLLWLVFGLAYAGDEWRTIRRPLDFIRFSGELFIYGVLILAGGVVLVGLVVAFFSAIGVPIEDFAQEWLGFSILLATPVIGAYLVEKKRSLIENLAPVLARIFIPLFLLMMVAFIAAVALRGQSIGANRDMLILIDILLLLVVGMVLYDLSARGDTETGGFTLPHQLNLALILAALVIDSMALFGIASRLAEFGFTPNRVAALGENILLAGNLVGLAVAYLRVATRRGSFSGLLAFQVRYLPVYFVWMVFVVFVLPVWFGFM